MPKTEGAEAAENSKSKNPQSSTSFCQNLTTENYGDMNCAIWQSCQNITTEKVLADFIESHEKLLEFARSFSDEKLFEKKHFAWTGITNLGAYVISTISSHYDWALKKLKAHIKIVAGK